MTKSIFIAGASSGIGQDLARAYASDSKTVYTIGIAARRKKELEKLKSEIQAQNRKVYIYVLDVTDLKAVQKALRDFQQKSGRLDIVVANAGIDAGVRKGLYPTEKISQVAHVNFCGVVHVCNEALHLMAPQKYGTIAATGSVAGFRPLPAATYSASKAAVKYYIDSMRMEHKNTGVKFMTICPGFILTPMTEKMKQPMPFLISSPKAAAMMKKAIEKNIKTYVFPFAWRLIIPLMKIIPDFIISAATRGK